MRSKLSVRRKSHKDHLDLEKARTGIDGFDEITGGGLPKGRPTLICGGPGCGKTLFASEFLVRGATEFDEPGVFVSFEETENELTKNVASLGFDLAKLQSQRKIILEHVYIERSEITETGEYDLEGLFVRLGHAIDSIGAKRVVLDTIEVLFASLGDDGILRAEIRRLFRFLKEKGVTALITAERGEGNLTRYGIEEYVSDCVISLDHRVHEQLTTRRLRVIKYRGSSHGTNEYPFLIRSKGFSVMPVTTMGLQATASEIRVSSGISQLDEMLEGKGYFSGSTIMVTGPTGCGKSSFASHFLESVCSHGKRSIYFSFEESAAQIVRNMKSIGIDLSTWEKKGLLKFDATRPSYYGLEMHLAQSIKLIEEFKPSAVVIDPLTDLTSIGSANEVKLMLSRLIDYLKNKGITAVITGLRSATDVSTDDDSTGISSLIDTWVCLNWVHSAGERNRTISIVKSRGMDHSNQVREFLLTKTGSQLVDIYLGTAGVLTGSMRVSQEAKDLAEAHARSQEVAHLTAQLEAKRKFYTAQASALDAELKAAEAELLKALSQSKLKEERAKLDRIDMAASRKKKNSKNYPKVQNASRNGSEHGL
ncbi:MAG: circadian clock protein KaiC [Bdellovibrionota bacterium]